MKAVKSLKDVRLINKKKILRNVYFHGPLSRLEISEYTGLSPATVGNLITPLIKEKIILEVGFEESKGGRRRVILEPNSKYGFFIGVDIGRTYIQIQVFDFCMNLIVSKKDLLAPGSNNLETIQLMVNNIVNVLLKECGINKKKLLGIGIALPGFVNNNSGQLSWCPIKEWEGYNVKSIFSNSFNVPIAVDNGSKAMAIAEKWLGKGKSTQNLISLILGRGIGAGVISNGSLVRGEQNYAGEWGHSTIAIRNGDKEIPNTTTVEKIVNQQLDLIWEHKGISGIFDPSDELENIQKYLSQNDSYTLEIVENIAFYLAVGISNLINLYNPKLIILGGWMGVHLHQYLLPIIKKNLSEITFSPLVEDLEFAISGFGKGESCIGAACLALDNFIEHI